MKKTTRRALAVLLAALVLLGLLAPLASASESEPEPYRAVLNDYGIHAEAAWDAGLTGAGVTVAVIDSGLNPGHMYGPKSIVAGRHFYWRANENGAYWLPDGGRYDYFSNDDTTDTVGHGTMMAGIIADIAPGATIMPIKCSDEMNSDWWFGNSPIIHSIEYAVEHGADVINLSFGYRRVSKELHDAVNRAVDAGCIVIAAVGNEGDATISYPAAYEEVIGVGAVNKAGKLAAFSNRNGAAALCAPGEGVRSIGWTSPDGLVYGNGTSVSTAIVSGAVALIKESYPEMTQEDLSALLKTNCDLVTLRDGMQDLDAGSGTLNMEKLMQGAAVRRRLRTRAWWIRPLRQEIRRRKERGQGT